MNEPTVLDLIIETHVGLERQGPGSPETTIKALSLVNGLNKNSRVLDLGCGTGGQTMVLAQNIAGNIFGIDQIPEFIDIFNENAKKLGLEKRVQGLVGSIYELPFKKEEFDLIWSEGVIDNFGSEKGLKYWHGFLKKNGYIVVSCASWFTDEHPKEIEKFWTDADCELNTIEKNISIMRKAGFTPIATFKLPKECWTNNYFVPREKAEKTLPEKYPGSKTVEAYMKDEKREVELYTKYNQYYGYAFYIGKK
ncbi:methyltransferase domain-containing protein [Candidatus Saccharibacteria bacterium]|nr:methyltransferase domain-containing protein [Candidatus Saccharibacteria bacterium]